MVRPVVLAAVLALLVAGCGPGAAPQAAAPEPTAPARVTSHEVRLYLAVRDKSLSRLEAELARVLLEGGDVASRVNELSVAEREAAESVGLEWRSYGFIKERVAQLLASQRQAEDRRLLIAELERTRRDLQQHAARARDAAGRAAIATRVATLDREIGELRARQDATRVDPSELAEVQRARPEMARLDSRQEELQRQLRQAVRGPEGQGGTRASGPGGH